jgi:hypothetical protein
MNQYYPMASFIGALLLANSALSWGERGHSMVGKIAMEFLNDNAKAVLKQAIPEGNGDLGNIASWADEIRNKNVFGEEWLWSAELHFVSIMAMPSKDCNYDDNRDCKNGKCIVGAIQNYTERASCLRGKKPTIAEQNIAVKFLTHFAGDIAQPLHNCNRAKGGNEVNVTFDGRVLTASNRTLNLHSIWDNDIVDKELNLKFENSTEKMIAFLVNEIRQGAYQNDAKTSWISTHSLTDKSANGNSMIAIDWARDSNGWNCINVWGPVEQDPTQDFGGAYFENAIPAVRMQIAKAGYRLAHHLNQIFDTCATTVTTTAAVPLPTALTNTYGYPPRRRF